MAPLQVFRWPYDRLELAERYPIRTTGAPIARWSAMVWPGYDGLAVTQAALADPRFGIELALALDEDTVVGEALAERLRSLPVAVRFDARRRTCSATAPRNDHNGLVIEADFVSLPLVMLNDPAALRRELASAFASESSHRVTHADALAALVVEAALDTVGRANVH